jgi:4-hydroxythreonine-4-phosphate dehydrogenase
MEKEAARTEEKPIVGITIGDVNGIGPEVIIKTLADARLLNLLTPVIYGSTKALSFYKKHFNINEFNYSQAKNAGQFFHRKVNVINCWNEVFEIQAGEETPEAGRGTFQALEKAVSDYKAGYIHALVTAPISKNNIQSDQFKFPGHTEYLGEKFGAKDFLMMMVGSSLRVGIATGHIPLKDVSNELTHDKLMSKLLIMQKSLKNDFGIAKPKIAILGLNPHAGENGLLGSEEHMVIKPVINELKSKGILAFGPYPADGFFGVAHYNKFDGIMAMYHDQGLTPFKTLAFDTGVNYTAGLPIIRTSPDHGTAYNIAGKGEADPSSLREALFLAIDIYNMRKETKETENRKTG